MAEGESMGMESASPSAKGSERSGSDELLRIGGGENSAPVGIGEPMAIVLSPPEDDVASDSESRSRAACGIGVSFAVET